MSEVVSFEYPDVKSLDELAKRRGYDTIQAYLEALIEADLEEEDLSPADRFREGWRDALSGDEGIPYDQIWDEIQSDEASS
jgi:hypothetical protein